MKQTPFLNFILCIGLLFFFITTISAQSIKGYVFLDENKNGIMESSEKGLEGVLVSNQKDVVLTDSKGLFKIDLIEDNFIFATKPTGYQFKLDEYNNPVVSDVLVYVNNYRWLLGIGPGFE